MARLYRHKQKGYQIHYLLYFQDGRQKRKYRYFRTKQKALAALQDLEQLEYHALKGTLTHDDVQYCLRRKYLNEDEASALLGSSPEIPTLEDLAKAYLRRSQIECRPKTHTTNVGRIKNILAYFGQDRRADTITVQDVEAYREQRLQVITAATVNKEVIKLAQMLDYALEKGSIQVNPARRVKRLRDGRERKPRALTDDEAHRLLQVAKEDRVSLNGMAYEVILTYLYTGMRRSELLYLEWEDVDIEHRRITIQAKMGKDGWITKTRKARVVGIAPRLLEVLSGMERKGRYVFGGDKPLCHECSISRVFVKLARRAGLPSSVTLHSLRHTYITHLLEHGINPRRVQQLAGHAVFSTTWRYSHVLPSEEVAEDVLDF